MSALPAMLPPLMLELAVKATVVLAVAAVLERLTLAGRGPAALRHLVWALALGCLLLLPLARLTVPEWRVPVASGGAAVLSPLQTLGDVAPGPVVAPAANAPALEQGAVAGAGAAPTAGASAGDVPGRRGPGAALAAVARGYWRHALVSIWLAGVLVLLARIGVEHVRARHRGRRAAAVSDATWRALLREAAAALRVRRRVQLLRSPGHTMPLTWGLLRPRIVLPCDADTWSAERRRAVLMHELAHVARHDCLTQTLAAITCALYWPHPGVWWAAARLRTERELACDDVAVTRGIRAVEYARHLLEIARSHPAAHVGSAAVSMAGASQLETRLRAVLHGARSRTAPGRVLVTAAGVAALAVLLPLSAVQAGAERVETALGDAAFGDAAIADSAIGDAAIGNAAFGDAATPSGAGASSIAAGQEFGGDWAIRLATASDGAENAGKVHVALRTPGLNTFYLPLSRFEGLTHAHIVAGAPAVRFELRQDAGTLHFDGAFAAGRGTGRFHYTPDSTFAAGLARRGVAGRLTPRQQFSMALHGVTLAFVDELQAEGYATPDAVTLERSGMTSIDLDRLRALGAQGIRLGTLDALISAHNRSSLPGAANAALPGAADAARDTGRDPSPTAGQPDGSTPLAGRWVATTTDSPAGAYIDLLWSDGTNWKRWYAFASLRGPLAEAVRLAAPVAFTFEQDAGSFIFEGAFADGSGSGSFRFEPNRGFAAVLRAAGFGDGQLTDHQLKNLTYGAMSAATARELRTLLAEPLELEGLIHFAIFQVTPDYARALQAAGIVDANTARGLVDLRHAGVPVELARELHALGYRQLTARQLADLHRAGATGAVVHEILESGRRDATPEALIELLRERRRRR